MENLGELLEKLTLLSLLEGAAIPMQRRPQGAEQRLREAQRPLRKGRWQESEPLLAPQAAAKAWDGETEAIGSASPMEEIVREKRRQAALTAEEISRYFERDARRYG